MRVLLEYLAVGLWKEEEMSEKGRKEDESDVSQLTKGD